MKIGYARVSTDEQSVDAQVDALIAAGCNQVFTDEGVSAVATVRPGLRNARAALEKGDTFVVWAIDRAFRSTLEAITFLDELRQNGIAFYSLTQQIDPNTPEGRKWFIDTASWAEYERAIISRRTKERMAAAKRRGQRLGRPSKLTVTQIEEARLAIAAGETTVKAMAEQFGVAPRTVARAIRRTGS